MLCCRVFFMFIVSILSPPFFYVYSIHFVTSVFMQIVRNSRNNNFLLDSRQNINYNTNTVDKSTTESNTNKIKLVQWFIFYKLVFI